MILDMGVEIRYSTPVDEPEGRCSTASRRSTPCSSARGAPRGKELDLPGRARGGRPTSTSASTGSSRVAFGHIDKIGERVLIIGVGNTAMDCCRTSRRLGGKDVKVMARRPRQFFKASPWELEDAEEEQVEIVVNHVAQALRGRERQADGHGVRARRVDARTRTGAQTSRSDRHRDHSRPTTSSWPSARRTPSPGSSATSASSSTSGTCRWSTRRPSSRRAPGVFFGGDAAFGPKNIIWAVAHGAPGGDLDPQPLPAASPVTERPPQGMNLHHARRWACTSGATATTTTRPSARR